jgi:hypothetical protein
MHTPQLIFDEAYQDNETGLAFGCVFKGAALTNRPVIKRMKPATQLAEQLPNKGEQMDPATQKMCSDLGVSSPEDIMKMIADLKGQLAAAQAAPAAAPDAAQMGEMKKQLSEVTTKLTEKETELATLKKDKELAEKTAKFDKLFSEGKVVAAQKEAFLSGDMEAFTAAAQPMKTTPAGSGETVTDDVDVDAEILKQAKKLAEEKKIEVHEAISEVLKNNKQLAEKRK